MIADDFKAIRERRNQLGGHDIIKEYVTPASERELTPVEKMRKEAEAAPRSLPPGTIHLGTITAGTLVTQELLDQMYHLLSQGVPRLGRELPEPRIGRSSKPVRFIGKSPLLAAPYKASSPGSLLRAPVKLRS